MWKGKNQMRQARAIVGWRIVAKQSKGFERKSSASQRRAGVEEEGAEPRPPHQSIHVNTNIWTT